MTNDDAGDLVISVEVNDADIAERLARLLGTVSGIRLARGNEPDRKSVV